MLRLPEPPIALLRLGTEAPGLLLREDRSLPEAAPTPGAPRVWWGVRDAVAAARELREAEVAVDEMFPVATGQTVEIADLWGNVVGSPTKSSPPDHARPSQRRARWVAGSRFSKHGG